MHINLNDPWIITIVGGLIVVFVSWLAARLSSRFRDILRILLRRVTWSWNFLKALIVSLWNGLHRWLKRRRTMKKLTDVIIKGQWSPLEVRNTHATLLPKGQSRGGSIIMRGELRICRDVLTGKWAGRLFANDVNRITFESVFEPVEEYTMLLSDVDPTPIFDEKEITVFVHKAWDVAAKQGPKVQLIVDLWEPGYKAEDVRELTLQLPDRIDLH